MISHLAGFFGFVFFIKEKLTFCGATRQSRRTLIKR